ncbi:hypothetical protein CDIK_4308, partial [Cucumispora dikerogammari]
MIYLKDGKGSISKETYKESEIEQSQSENPYYQPEQTKIKSEHLDVRSQQPHECIQEQQGQTQSKYKKYQREVETLTCKTCSLATVICSQISDTRTQLTSIMGSKAIHDEILLILEQNTTKNTQVIHENEKFNSVSSDLCSHSHSQTHKNNLCSTLNNTKNTNILYKQDKANT